MAKGTFSVGVKDGLCVRELLGATHGYQCWSSCRGEALEEIGGVGVVLRIVPDSKVLKTLSLTMVDKSDVLLMCGGEALILQTVRRAGWGGAVVLLNAEHDPGCREAVGGETERHSLLMLMGLALDSPELGAVGA